MKILIIHEANTKEMLYSFDKIIFLNSVQISHTFNWITPASLIQQTFLIVILFVYTFLSVSKRYKL